MTVCSSYLTRRVYEVDPPVGQDGCAILRSSFILDGGGRRGRSMRWATTSGTQVLAAREAPSSEALEALCLGARGEPQAAGLG